MFTASPRGYVRRTNTGYFVQVKYRHLCETVSGGTEFLVACRGDELGATSTRLTSLYIRSIKSLPASLSLLLL